MIEIKKETVYQNNYKLRVLVIYSVLLRAEEIDNQLIEMNLWEGNHTRYVLFKATNADIRLGALYTNNMVNIRDKYEILENVSVNQLVTVDGEMIWLKEYLLGLKAGENSIFLEAKQGWGKYSSDVFVIIAPNQNLQAMK